MLMLFFRIIILVFVQIKLYQYEVCKNDLRDGGWYNWNMMGRILIIFEIGCWLRFLCFFGNIRNKEI